MNILKRYVVIEFVFFLCQYPEIMTWSLLCNDIMRFSVLGFRSDIRIELQAPVDIILYKIWRENDCIGGGLDPILENAAVQYFGFFCVC